MKRDMRVYIEDILECIAMIEEYTKEITNAEVGEHIAELLKDSNRINEAPTISVPLNLNTLHDHCTRRRYEF